MLLHNVVKIEVMVKHTHIMNNMLYIFISIFTHLYKKAPDVFY